MKNEFLISNEEVWDIFLKCAYDFKNLIEQINESTYAQIALGNWTCISLIGHTLRSIRTVSVYVADPLFDIEPDLKVASDYFGVLDLKNKSLMEQVELRGISEGESIKHDVLGQVETSIKDVITDVSQLSSKAVVKVIQDLTIPVTEYLKTRIFELTVHSLDIAKAMNLEFKPNDEAIKICIEILIKVAEKSHILPDILLALTGREVELKDISIF